MMLLELPKLVHSRREFLPLIRRHIQACRVIIGLAKFNFVDIHHLFGF